VVGNQLRAPALLPAVACFERAVTWPASAPSAPVVIECIAVIIAAGRPLAHAPPIGDPASLKKRQTRGAVLDGCGVLSLVGHMAHHFQLQ
jgi:hypothetical protein